MIDPGKLKNRRGSWMAAMATLAFAGAAPESTAQDEMGVKTAVNLVSNLGKLRKAVRLRRQIRNRGGDPNKTVVVYPTVVNVPVPQPGDDEEARRRRLLDELLEELRRRRESGPRLPPGPAGGSPSSPEPSRPDPEEERKRFDEEIRRAMEEQLRRNRKKAKVESGSGGYSVFPFPVPLPPGSTLPPWPAGGGARTGDGTTVVVVEPGAGGGGVIGEGGVVLPPMNPVGSRPPVGAGDGPTPLIGAGPKPILVDPGDIDGDVVQPLVPAPPADDLDEFPNVPPGDLSVFSGEDSDWFFTASTGIRQTEFDVQMRGTRPVIGLGRLPGNATSLGFNGNPVWNGQPRNQRPGSLAAAGERGIVIDPRSALERNPAQYTTFLNGLIGGGGLRGFKRNPLDNYELVTIDAVGDLHLSSEEEAAFGSFFFGHRSWSVFPEAGENGGFFFEGGLNFSWSNDMDLVATSTNAWNGTVVANYNDDINRLRPLFSNRFQPVNRFAFQGMQTVDLNLDQQALGFRFGPGYEFPCGCRLTLTLEAGWTFQQWDLSERMSVTGNGSLLGSVERRSSGSDGMPSLSGMIELAFPIAENTEFIIYSGTVLAVGNRGPITGSSVQIDTGTNAWENRQIGLGISVKF